LEARDQPNPGYTDRIPFTNPIVTKPYQDESLLTREAESQESLIKKKMLGSDKKKKVTKEKGKQISAEIIKSSKLYLDEVKKSKKKWRQKCY